MNLAEGVQLVTFCLLGGMMLLAALGVVLLPNIVFSAFLLGGVFICMAGQYLLLNADFVAAAQVLIYVGAVNVLILFAIMLVNKRQDFPNVPNIWVRRGVTAIVCLGLFALLSSMVVVTPWAISSAPPSGNDSIVVIGEHFFSDFLLPFELASLLLLMALIGAVVLARREFLPDEALTSTRETVLMLPERPRELTGTSSRES